MSRCRPVSNESIPMLDVSAQNAPILDRLIDKASEVLRSGRFILGPEVEGFEREVAEAIGVDHAIGVSSGTDALVAALMALDIGEGDEVITTPFSFFATAGSIVRVGATPVFVDIRPDTFNLDLEAVEASITTRTRAVLPVHLFGQACEMGALTTLAAGRDLFVIEDAAQSIGATSAGAPVGALGNYGCFSFFPSKNLGGFGDGGLVTTSDAERAEAVRIVRAHGSNPKYHHAIVGGNFRLDALQAALLRIKLEQLPAMTDGRRDNAARYDAWFADAGLCSELLTTPARAEPGHVYNQYVIRTSRRDDLQRHLAEQKIATAIYYPVPLHRQRCFEYLGYGQGSLPEAETACNEVLALPIFAGLGETRQARVVDSVVAFLRR